jgi:hypothetical protein
MAAERTLQETFAAAGLRVRLLNPQRVRGWPQTHYWQ